MDKHDLLNTIQEYFIANPLSNADEVKDLVDKGYRSARQSNISPYHPISVKRKIQKDTSYEAEIKQVNTKSLQDESLNEDY